MWKWITGKKQQNNQPSCPPLSQQQAQEILQKFQYRTVADLIYKDDDHPNLNVEEAKQQKVELQTNCFLDKDGVLRFNPDQLSWVDEDEQSEYEEDELDKKIYEEMYQEMQKEMYDQHEDREHFEPIVGGNDNEWETESEHDIEN